MTPDRPPSASSERCEDVPSALDALSPLEFEALQWTVRLGDAPGPVERLAFERWLSADGRHRSAFLAMQADLDRVDAHVAALAPEVIASLRACAGGDRLIDARSVSDGGGAGARSGSTGRSLQRQGDVPHPSRDVRRRRVAAVLVAGLASLVIGGAGLGWLHWQGLPLFNDQFATAKGQQMEAGLPDGSRLVLDTATVAEVALYRHRREVRLPEGQVLFDVSADSSRPFDVLAGTTRITVIGTRFSVRYAPSLGSEAVEVAVLDGRVQVAPRARDEATGASASGPAAGSGPPAGEAPVELQPGQVYRSDGRGGPGTVLATPIASMATWRDQRLVFDGAPLSAVLAEIERYQPARIRLRDAAAGELTVTASVDLREFRAFIRHLPAVLPVRVTTEDDGSQVISLKR